MTKKCSSNHVHSLRKKANYQEEENKYQLKEKSRGIRYQKVEYYHFSDRQNFLYNRALFGLSVYTELEIKGMRKEQRNRIKKVHKRARVVLNTWKQELINQFTNNFLKKYFPKSPVTKSFLENTILDPAFKCNISFRTLNINKKQIADKLVNEGILPHNFYELKTK